MVCGKGINFGIYTKKLTLTLCIRNCLAMGRKLELVFSTPLDEGAVDFLEKINCPFYKVAL